MSDLLVTSSRSPSLRQYHPDLLSLEVDNVAPSISAVALDEVKEYLRVDGNDQDAVITAMIDAATMWAESVTRRTILQKDWRATFSEAPPGRVDLVLPKPNVLALTEISYTDSDGSDQTISATEFDLEPTFGRVRIKPDATIEEWPRDVFKFVVRYRAGYGASADVPTQIKLAINVAIGQMFELRVDQTVGGQISKPHNKASWMLLQDFRVREF